ncbi:hypothetical protein BGX28_008351 [Mortierella sp. GBA30]|nr:hypothetical protein BGX28_008351 [Mortierella sp. GBA30]
MEFRPSERYSGLSMAVGLEERQSRSGRHCQQQQQTFYVYPTPHSSAQDSSPCSSPRSPQPVDHFQQNPYSNPVFPQQAWSQRMQPYPHGDRDQHQNQSRSQNQRQNQDNSRHLKSNPNWPSPLPPFTASRAGGYPTFQSHTLAMNPIENYPSLPPPALSNHNIVIPKRNSSAHPVFISSPRSFSNSSGPGSSSSGTTLVSHSDPTTYRQGSCQQQHQQQEQQRLHWTSSTLEPTTNHPLGLNPPNPRFARAIDRHPSRDCIPESTTSSRRGSMHSDISVRSSEPLQPLQRDFSAGTMDSPRKPFSIKSANNYNNNSNTVFKYTKTAMTTLGANRRGNNLDLPEQKWNPARDSQNYDTKPRPSTSSVASSNNSKTVETTKKKKGRLLSRLGRICRGPQPYNPQKYKMTGMGRETQFSNERLYMHWIRFGILQGMIAVMLLSFGIGVASYIGVGAIVLAMLTLIYGTQLYHTRHLNMVNKRKDVKYFARTIPTLLTLGLMLLYGANFAVMMTYPMDTWNPPPWTKDDNFGHYF